MLLQKLLTPLCAAFFAVSATAAHSSHVQAPEGDDSEDIAGVLVVKIPLDDKGNELQDGATLIPLNVTAKFWSEGLDTDALEKDCDGVMSTAKPIALVSDNFTQDDVPQDVQEMFDYASSQMSDEQISWRVWSPIGSIGSRGYYGYGHYRPWGYNNRYGRYYPRYGYYNSGRHYPYYYGHSRRYGNYRYHYYHR